MPGKPLPQPVRIYRVGGSVRDELLGRPVADRDWVVVGATPEMMVASGYRPVGRDFPVFLHPETHEEYALARTERKAGAGYRGFAFFASPEVTLEDDLRRRDLTINAMARAEDGSLVDPYGGRRDLDAGVLRHVSDAFVEDPLRVLRVARFAARFGFAVAPATRRLLREIVRGGELATLAPERVWTELATGLGEAAPSRMLRELRASGALAALLPEVDELFDAGAGGAVGRALDRAAGRGAALAVRYAVLAQDPRSLDGAGGTAAVRRVDNLSSRLRVPAECRELAQLAARWLPRLARAGTFAPARWLELLTASDALRRPERLNAMLEVGASYARAAWRPAQWVRDALTAVRSVDAGAVAAAARESAARSGSGAASDAIARAVRAARLKALRGWLGEARKRD
jgi:tRNA nucleotidyltransferase (CCA-adding enzyme)